MSDNPTPDPTNDDAPEAETQEQTENETSSETADGPAEAAEPAAEPTTETTEADKRQQVAGQAAQPTVDAGEGSGDVVVMQEPGGSMTSTGDQIVEDDLGDMDFEEALEGTLKSMSEGEIVEGVVVKIDPDEVLLDIGWKSEGVIPARELSIKLDVDPGEVVQVGDVVEALIMHSEDEQGRLVLSKKRAQYERAWGTIERIYHDDGTVVGTVIEVVKGGLILDIGLRGFLPASLVEMRRVRDLEPYVGTQLECKIIELDRNRNNVVLSRRKFLEETQSEFRQEFLQSLQKGEIRKGVVSSIVNFGAFVDLGGVDGLVHVSELSWHHIDHPSEVVEVGDEVEVEVLDVDLERERVSLSLKATQEDPWQKFAREHQVGEVVEGEVTKLVPFGAFVKVAEGIEGLVHISELADRHVEVPEAVVNVGENVDVKVIDIDTVRRRISLSLKQAAPGTETTDEDEYGEEPTVAPAYSSGAEEEPASGTMAGALADAGLAPSSSEPSPEEMALAEAELPDEVTAPAPSEDAETGAAVAPDEDADDSTVETKAEAADEAEDADADEVDGAEPEAADGAEATDDSADEAEDSEEE
ncbi:MAG: 30S ribosomal protein S1 [Nitriliruptorales bacterium]|nr:30S ribosomal protein S1 [Nitriliruptorales bacterium]